MFIDSNKILKALSYYMIEDLNYRNKSLDCVEILNSNDYLNRKFEDVYNILYNGPVEEISKFWDIKEATEIFGDGYIPFTTNILILLGYDIHKNNMEKMEFSDTEKILYKDRVREILLRDVCIKKFSGMRIAQMIFASYFINTKIIEVGRLQYENCKDYIKIHIPYGRKLDIGEVIDSIHYSKLQIKQKFKIENPTYYCNSWLLSKQVNSLIDKDSNIHNFYNLFCVEDGKDATKDILNFVFDIQGEIDYKSLCEETSLQRLLKKELINGSKFRMGKGKLKI